MLDLFKSIDGLDTSENSGFRIFGHDIVLQFGPNAVQGIEDVSWRKASRLLLCSTCRGSTPWARSSANWLISRQKLPNLADFKRTIPRHRKERAMNSS
jgi:hypothetical protein